MINSVTLFKNFCVSGYYSNIIRRTRIDYDEVDCFAEKIMEIIKQNLLGKEYYIIDKSDIM